MGSKNKIVNLAHIYFVSKKYEVIYTFLILNALPTSMFHKSNMIAGTIGPAGAVMEVLRS